MSIISVPNLKEIETWEGYFMRFKHICNFVQRRRNVKKIGQYLGTNISRSAEAISFNFDM